VYLNRAVPRRLEVVAGLATAAAFVAGASGAGASLRDQGLAREDARSGLRVGTLVGVPIAIAVTLGALVPRLQRLYQDERIVRASDAEALYQVTARIPLATAVTEELVFRGALEGLFAKRRPRSLAALMSGGLFGLWHVLPALDHARANPDLSRVLQRREGGGAGLVFGTMALTAIAGLCLSWLRSRTGSVVAPIVVHAAANIGGFLGGWLQRRRATDVV
jgi:membrane protease YdiL (CAAX protease family)